MNHSKYGRILSFRYEAIIVAMSLLIICTKSSLCDENFGLNFIDDIPVMDSMKIEPELSFGFDSPSGRIIILIAASNDSRESIEKFYSEVMPQLGWKISGKQYHRGEEKFEFISSNNLKGLIWRLSITPLTIP